MDERRALRADEPRGRAAPFVVVFFWNGTERQWSARVRDVGSQQQWIVPDAQPLRDLLTRAPRAPDTPGDG